MSKLKICLSLGAALFALGTAPPVRAADESGKDGGQNPEVPRSVAPKEEGPMVSASFPFSSLDDRDQAELIAEAIETYDSVMEYCFSTVSNLNPVAALAAKLQQDCLKLEKERAEEAITGQLRLSWVGRGTFQVDGGKDEIVLMLFNDSGTPLMAYLSKGPYELPITTKGGGPLAVRRFEVPELFLGSIVAQLTNKAYAQDPNSEEQDPRATGGALPAMGGADANDDSPIRAGAAARMKIHPTIYSTIAPVDKFEMLLYGVGESGK